MFRFATMIALLAMPVMADAQQLRDPTKPLSLSKRFANNTTNSNEAVRLQSIFISGNSKTAIINDKTYRVGDRIQDYRLISIDRAKVVLANESDAIELKIFKQAVTK